MAITWNGGCGEGGGVIYTPGPGIQINSENEISADVRRDMITLPEVSPAESAHAVGEYLIFNNGLYRVDAAIAAGDILTPETNIMPTSVGRELSSLKQSLAIKTLDTARHTAPSTFTVPGISSCRILFVDYEVADINVNTFVIPFASTRKLAASVYYYGAQTVHQLVLLVQVNWSNNTIALTAGGAQYYSQANAVISRVYALF